MGHTLYMARVRSKLRVAIKARGQNRAAAALDCEQEIGDGQTIAGGLKVNAREASEPETPEGMENGEEKKVGTTHSFRGRGGKGVEVSVGWGGSTLPRDLLAMRYQINGRGSHANLQLRHQSVPQLSRRVVRNSFETERKSPEHGTTG